MLAASEAPPPSHTLHKPSVGMFAMRDGEWFEIFWEEVNDALVLFLKALQDLSHTPMSLLGHV